MKFSISQSELLNALTIVQKGISPRATLPVLAGVYLQTTGDEVSFQTTDLEMSVQYNAAALIDEPGRAVLPGKLFIDIVKNLPDAAVHIETSDDGAVVSCESSSFSIRVLDPEDFPGFPQVSAEQQISVPFDAFSSMARKVCRVVSKDEARMILTGVLISVEEGTLKLVATDSYRLAVTKHALGAAPVDSPAAVGALPGEGGDLPAGEGAPEAGQEDFSAVLSGGFVSDLAGLPKTGGQISFALAENQIVVSYADTVFVNRRIEGKYPNYKQLIPDAHATRCIVDRSALAAAVKRASLLDTSGSKVRFSINVASQTIQLNTTQDVGSTQEIIKAQIEGEDVEIGFNSFYVTEGLTAMDSREVSFEFQGAMKPGVIKGADSEDYLYLVMPVRI